MISVQQWLQILMDLSQICSVGSPIPALLIVNLKFRVHTVFAGELIQIHHSMPIDRTLHCIS